MIRKGVNRFMPLYELTAHELHEKLKARELPPSN